MSRYTVLNLDGETSPEAVSAAIMQSSEGAESDGASLPLKIIELQMREREEGVGPLLAVRFAKTEVMQ